MNIELKETQGGEAQLKLNLTKEDYYPRFQKKLKEYAKQMKMKGFRPGKVPPSVVRRMHGKSILAEEINSLVGETLDDYIKAENLNMLGQPIPESEVDVEALHAGDLEDVEVDFTIGTFEDFEVPDLESLTLPKYKIKVQDEDIDKSIENLKERFGEVVEPEESEKGDVISGKLHFEDEETEPLPFYLPFDKVKEGQEDLFIGLKKGDSVELKMTDHFREEDLENLTGAKDETLEKLKNEKVKYEVERITRKKPAELGQTLYDQVFGEGEVTSEEAMREELVKRHEQEYDRYAESVLFRDIREKLVDEVEINLPDEFLKRFINYSKEEEEKMSEEELEKEYPAYARDLKWQLIAEKVAKAAEIQVEPQEVMEFTKQKIREQFAQMGMAQANDEMVEQVAGNVMQNRERMQEYYQEMFFNKVFQHIAEQVQTEEKPVDSFEDIPGIEDQGE